MARKRKADLRRSLMSRAFLVLGLLLTVAPPGPAIGQEGSPAGPVPVDRLRARREALLRRIGNGIALIRNPPERSDDPPDSDYPQDNGFRRSEERRVGK